MLIESAKISKYLFFVVFFSSFLLAQNNNSYTAKEISRDSLVMVSHAIIESAGCRVLITVDENGKPHAREMDPFTPGEDMVVWLGTSPKTRKVKQIENNPNVVVFFYDTKGLSYVSIEGKARLINDPTLKAKYWKDNWNRFYPDRGKDFILIQVTPVRLELVSYKHNLFNLTTDTFMPRSVEFETIKTKDN
jgi:general stress protein 26